MDSRVLRILGTLLCILGVSFADMITPSGNFKVNCFSDESHGTCEESRVKICGDFYACDYVKEFDHPPKRIAYLDGEILVAVDSETYAINNHTLLPERVSTVIPPWGELVDNKGNKYYAGDGTSYVMQIKTGKEIEIITTGEYSFNQHALDVEAKKLFILTFSSQPGSKIRSGNLFAVTTDPLEVDHNKVHAEKVEEAGTQITALAVQDNLDTVLLGTKSTHGGKFIRLIRLNYDPCSLTERNKASINEIIHETQYKILNIFDNTVKVTTRDSLISENLHESQKALSIENARLKRELDSKNSKISSFMSDLSEIKALYLKKVDPPKDAYAENKVEEISIAQAQAAHENSEDPHVCVPTSHLKSLNDRVVHLLEFEQELSSKLYKVSSELEGILNTLRGDKVGIETRSLGSGGGEEEIDDSIKFLRK